MKTERNILTALILNLSFSIFEFFGGMITGSVAIVSDAVHDVGDAASIGISYFLERKSKKQPDEKHTYGYARYSVIGGCITTLILVIGSVVMIYTAINRMFVPNEIKYEEMIVFAAVGVCVNFCAAFFTREGDSVNEKAVNLHMFEDVLGWIIVLVGAVVMRFTNFALIDPIISIGVSLFVLIHAIGNLKEIADLLLEKVPRTVDVAEIKEHVKEINGIFEIHHIHLWSMDGQHNFATMHIVTDCEAHVMKDKIRQKLRESGIEHVTIEIETSSEHCYEKECRMAIHSHVEYGHHSSHYQ